jgi:hypothetical protein
MRTAPALSDKQLEILQHALGLDQYGRGSEYRNRFVTGPGSADFDRCRELVGRGFMEDHGTHALYGGSHLFAVTDTGRRYVRGQSPRPPKLTVGQRRYQRYLDADCGLSFGEWLRGGG